MEGDFQGIKVMVIDDSKTIRRTAETLLSKVGCDVVTAVDGFDALAKIADTRPSIIFVDITTFKIEPYLILISYFIISQRIANIKEAW